MSDTKSKAISQELASLISKAAIQLEHDGRGSLAVALLRQLLEGGISHLPIAEQSHLRAGLSGIVWKQGYVTEGRELADSAVALAEECADPEALSDALFSLGEVIYIEEAYMGNLDLGQAMVHHQRCLEVRRKIGDR